MTLSAKRAKFCAEYLVDLNASAAAIRAGYARSGAGTEGQRLLQNAEIVRRIAELRAKSDSEAIASHEECCQRLTRHLRTTVADFVTPDGEVATARFADPKLCEGVDSYKVTTVTTVGDDGETTTRKVEFRLSDRLKAFERLAKFKGYDAADRVEIDVRPIQLLPTPPIKSAK